MLVPQLGVLLGENFSGNKAPVKLVLATLATTVLFYFYGLHKKFKLIRSYRHLGKGFPMMANTGSL